jgi:hypothetical protein
MSNRLTGKMRERVLFQKRGLDDNNDPLGDWVTVASQAPDGAWSVEIIRLRGGEAVQAQRLQGLQPVIIGARPCLVTRQLDSAWRAVDARSGQIFEITNANLDETRTWVEVLATAKAGDLVGR